MNSEQTPLTPAQARERLDASRPARSLGSARDRTVHAVGTAIVGLSLGAFAGARNLVEGAGEIALSAAFAAVLVAQLVWVERTARTVPRHARRWSRFGIGASLLVALAVAYPWLNLQAQTEPNTWPMVVVAACVVAVPSLVAAVAIARGGR